MTEQLRATHRGLLFGISIRASASLETLVKQLPRLEQLIDQTQNRETSDGTLTSSEEWELFRDFAQAVRRLLDTREKVVAHIEAVLGKEPVRR